MKEMLTSPEEKETPNFSRVRVTSSMKSINMFDQDGIATALAYGDGGPFTSSASPLQSPERRRRKDRLKKKRPSPRYPPQSQIKPYSDMKSSKSKSSLKQVNNSMSRTSLRSKSPYQKQVGRALWSARKETVPAPPAKNLSEIFTKYANGAD